MRTESDSDGVARAVMAKVSWRILPFIFLSYLVAYVDRANVSFASLQMNADLKFSATVYGFGAGLFFIGYALFELPSNLLLVRFGARRWIARIMFTWGAISCGMMLVRTPMQFYVMRFLLGAAEAGFFPGVMLYLSLWFPNAWRGRAISRFYIASPMAVVLMGLAAGALLGLDGRLGLAGWQWLFLCEGAPALALALAVLLFLPDAPERVGWLNVAEKAWLSQTLAADAARTGAVEPDVFRAALHPLVLTFGTVMGLVFACGNALALSAPKLLVAATGWTPASVGGLTALGGALSTAAMLFMGWNSDRTGDRRWHTAAIIALTAAGVAIMALGGGPTQTVLGYLVFAAFSLSLGVLTSSLVADAMPPSARAVSFAALNTIAQVCAFFGPLLWGVAADRTGGFEFGLCAIPVLMAVAVWLTLSSRSARRVAHPVLSPSPATQG